MTSRRAVVVHELPELLTREQAHLFMQEIGPLLNADRPRIVFDCSDTHQLGSVAVELLLCCMEEVMKRNGDLKLAAVPAGPRAVLEFTGVDRLFEIYDNASDAVQSFHQMPVEEFEQVPPLWSPSAVAQGDLP
jgi:anti-sigma B factor antagonist